MSYRIRDSRTPCHDTQVSICPPRGIGAGWAHQSVKILGFSSSYDITCKADGAVWEKLPISFTGHHHLNNYLILFPGFFFLQSINTIHFEIGDKCEAKSIC